LGQTEERLQALLAQLYPLAFPRAMPPFERWDRVAVDRWLDHQSGLGNSTPPLVAAPKLYVDPRNRRPPALPPEGSPDPAIDYGVADALHDYMRWFETHRRCVRDTRYQIETYIRPEFGALSVASLSTEHIRAWHQGIAERPRRIRSKRNGPTKYSTAPMDAEAKRRRQSSANRSLIILKAVLNFAYRDGRVASDAAWRRVRPFPRVSVGKGGYLTVPQIRAMLDHVTDDFRQLVLAALLTGARYGELRRLKAGAFDPQVGSLFISDSKTRRSRHVVLNSEGQRLFGSLSAGLAPEDHILRRADGDPWNQTDCYKRLDLACDLAGIVPRVTFHQLRHTYASLLAMKGTPMAVIAKNLGHATTEPCERYYVHLAPSYVRETICEKLPELDVATPSANEPDVDFARES
jgi:integrase